MTYHTRYIESLLPTPPSRFQAILITGPRRSGKSTLSRKLLERWGGAAYYSFDTPDEIARFRNDREFFIKNLQRPAVLDEVQNVPEIFSYLKSVIDTMPAAPCQFILTGSHQFQMMKNVSDSLAGRLAIYELFPFGAGEVLGTPADLVRERLSKILSGDIHLLSGLMQRSFSKGSFPFTNILHGGYPQANEIESENELLQWFTAYVQTYIQRDIRDLSAIQDLGQFDRFLRIIAGRTGKEINYSSIGKDIGVSYHTAKKYLSLLEASYVWRAMPAFSGNTERRVVKSPKGVFIDSGLACFLTGVYSERSLQASPLKGQIYESYVISEFIKLLSAFSPVSRLSHFRSSSKKEVDLIIEFGEVVIPVEIKCSATPRGDWGGGISYFRGSFPAKNIPYGVVVSLAPEVYEMGEGVWNFPAGIFWS